MLRTATRSHSRTVTKRTVRAAHVSSSSSAFRFSDSTGVGSTSSRCRAKDISPQWIIGIRLYTVSAPKGVKQLVKDSPHVPPPLPSSASTKAGSSSSSTTTSGKKRLEPKLAPRKVGSSNSGSHSSSPIRGSEHAYEAPLSRPTLHSSKTPSLSAKHMQHQRTTAPFLVKPAIPPNLGIIKTAFNDIDDALTNGTLEPLPPALLKAQEAQRRRKLASDSAATTVKADAKMGDEGPTMIGDVEFTADTGKIWWHKLKEMTKFYFFGVLKLGREHRVIASQISRRLREAGVVKGVHTWRDREFVKTYRMDLLRLVPFISIIVILEEILPLVVIYAPFLLPSTCKLPAQAKRIDDLADVKRWDSLVALGGVLALRDGLDASRGHAVTGSWGMEGATPAPVLGHEKGVLEGRLDRLPEGSIPLLCRLLNIAPYGPPPYLKFRLRSTLAALSSEDTYFSDSKSSTTTTAPKVSSVDAISQLSLSELRTVLGRRGFPTTPLTLPQLRENLKWWLAQNEHPVERRLEAVLELARWSHRESAIPGGPARS